MSTNNNPNKTIIPPSSGFFVELANRFRLIGRLMVDSRVNLLVKLLPVGAVAYAIWPIDIPGPIDDAAVLWLGTTLFVQLCPPEVVDEHMRNIHQRDQAASQGQYASTVRPEDDVIDGEFTETDHNSGKQNQNYPR